MAETTQERQARITTELQTLLASTYPDMDFSAGTVLYDMLIKPASVALAQQEETVETVRNNMSIAQVMAAAEPDPTLVDNLLSNYGVYRIAGMSATGQINVYTKANQNIYISKNSEFTCNGISLQPVKSYVGVPSGILPEDTPEISYVLMRDFGDGTKVFSLTAQTTEAATTVLAAGQSCTSTVNNPLITRIETGSTFTGGRVEETTTELLERARTSMNARVVTGRDNIRSLLSTQTTVNVIDSAVFGMGDSLQTRDAMNNAGISGGGRVDIYVKTAPVPITAITTLHGYRQPDGSWLVRIPSESYPGSYGVSQLYYGRQMINTALNHIIDYTPSGPWPLVESPFHARYSKYQNLSIQFTTDAVADALMEADFIVYVIMMPGVDVLQDYLADPSIRSCAFDELVKAAISVAIEVDVDIEYIRGTVPVDAGVIAQTISDIVNLKPIGTEALYSSDVVYACRLAFSTGVVRMPVNLRARVYLPDGTVAYSASQNHIKIEEGPGISYRNCMFSCFPADVNVHLTEVLP